MLRVLGVVDETEVEEWKWALHWVGEKPQLPDSPFPGLNPFEEGDADYFYGRRALVDELLGAVDDGLAGDGPRVVVVFGVSGAGKSSALRAGLHARRPKAELITPTSQPKAELDSALAKLAAAGDEEQVLIVDQCEELWTQQPNDDVEGVRRREEFLEALSLWLAESQRVAVIGLPAEYLGRALTDQRFPADQRPGVEHNRPIRVDPMNREELTEAICEPVARTGVVTIEESLVTTLLDELEANQYGSETGALPLLAYALQQTWDAMERRGKEHVLTIEDYLSTGGIRGAVAKYADAIYNELSEIQQSVVQRVMLKAVIVTADSQARDRVPREKLQWDGVRDDDVELVIERYVEQRLLTSDDSGIQISHEALLKEWPLLTQWIGIDRDSHIRHRQLSNEATEWDSHGRNNRHLLSRGRTEEYKKWIADKGSIELGRTEQQFLRANEVHHRIRAALRAMGVSVLVIALVVTIGTTVAALISRNEARRARDEGLSRQAALQWELLRGRDPALAQQVALAGYQVSPTLEARSALLDSTAVLVPHRSPTVNGPTSTALSSDGVLLAVCNSDGKVRLFQAGEPGDPPIATFPVPMDRLYAVAFRPGTRQLAVGGKPGAQLWDVTDPAVPRQLTVLPEASGKVENLAWSPDGNELAAAADKAGTIRWSVALDGKQATTAAVLPSTNAEGTRFVSTTVAYSPDGALLAAAGTNATVEFWDRRSDRPTPVAQLPLGGPGWSALDLAFDRSSTKLAVGTGQNQALVVDLTDHTKPAIIQRAGGFTSLVNAVAFHPDGTTLAAGSSDNSVQIFDVGSDSPARLVLPGRGIITSLLFRGDELVTAGNDGFIRTWPLPGPVSRKLSAPIRTFTGSADGTTAIVGFLREAADSTPDQLHQFTLTDSGELTERGPHLKFHPTDRSSGASTISPDGRIAAAGTAARSLYIWDISKPSEPGPPVVLPDIAPSGIAALVFTPDSRYLFAGSSGDSRQVVVIDRADPVRPVVLDRRLDAGDRIQLLSVSNDGKYLVAGTSTGIRLWDISAGPGKTEVIDDDNGIGANVSAVRFGLGNLLAAGSANETVRLYRADHTGLTELARLDGPTGQIQSLSFDSRATRLAAGIGDDQIWVWDISNPSEPLSLAALSAYDGRVNDVVYGPHDRNFTAAGDARVLQTWLADADAVARALCEHPAALITEEEWNRYLPGTEYQPPCR